MNRFYQAAIAAVVTVGCAGSESSEGLAEVDHGANSQNQLVEDCVAFREKAAECREIIVDEWVSLRARHRADLREALRTPVGAAEIRAIALKEFEEDGSGPLEPRIEKCRQVVERAPPIVVQKARAFDDCAGLAACDRWATCVLPRFGALLDATPKR